MTMATRTGSTRLTSRAAAEAYVGGVCFKLGPPRLIGAELEWLTSARDGGRPCVTDFAAALGSHAPTTIAPDSPADPLPGGSLVTLEPGGQIELSSPPVDSADDLCGLLESDTAHLRSLLRREGITMLDAPTDVERRAERILPAPRYRAMQGRFDRIGPFGRLMMCNTTATQVSVDAGDDADEVAARLGPVRDGPGAAGGVRVLTPLEGDPEGGVGIPADEVVAEPRPGSHRPTAARRPRRRLRAVGAGRAVAVRPRRLRRPARRLVRSRRRELRGLACRAFGFGDRSAPDPA